MDDLISFGYWVRRRRKALDLTQAQLAKQVGCAEITIQKIEADERRPSRQVAELLAEHLQIPAHERAIFLQSARGELADLPSVSASPTDSIYTPSTTPGRPVHNLPVQLTSFVGRERELTSTAELLAGARLLTLTGPGGTGKTRLALQLAQRVLERFPDGVWLVELALLADPQLIPQAIAGVLGLREEPDRPLLAKVIAHLQAKQALLLLDNCEHLIDACAALVEELLQTCPRLRILASSREPLGIGGEAIFRVPALSVPDPTLLAPSDELARSEAVQLFIERIRATQPAFMLDDDTAPVVVQVCSRLDGIPLAIELAAARARVMTVEQIAARLGDRFRLLTGGSRTALPRHQTLQALIDWSHDLLGEDERVLLRRQAVFIGGWTLEAVEDVCAGGKVADVLESLSQLVDKSLVQVELQRGLARYRMLETIRQYALEKLAASGEADDVRHRHAHYYLAFAESDDVAGGSEVTYLRYLETEHDNFRAALRWAFEQPETELALQLVRTLGWFWYRGGHWNEGRTWIERVLLRPTAQRTSLHAFLLGLQGFFAWHQGDGSTGEVLLRESVALFRELGDTEGSGYPLLQLMIVAREQGDGARAAALYDELSAINRMSPDKPEDAWLLTTMGGVAVLEEHVELANTLLSQSLSLFRERGQKSGIGWTLNHLGHVAQLQGDWKRAAELHAESLPLFREADQQGVAWAFESLGEVALAQGDFSGARARFLQSLKVAQNLSYKPCIAWCLAGLGSAAALDEEPERAVQLWGAAERLRATLGCRPAPAARATYEHAIATARSQLGDGGFAAAWAASEAISLEHVLAEAFVQT